MAKTTEQDVMALAELKEKLGRGSRIEELMNEFNEKYPCGDSFELAEFMYKNGLEDGFKETIG